MAKAHTADSKMIADSGAKPKKSDKPKSGGSGKPAKPNVFARFAQYVRDVRSEMKRVVWPTRPEVINLSMVVVVTLIFFVVFTLITDTAVVRIIKSISEIGQ